MRMHVCYLDCHEAELCCCLVIHTENLLCPLQMFYFHLWPIYWLSLVHHHFKFISMIMPLHQSSNSTGLSISGLGEKLCHCGQGLKLGFWPTWKPVSLPLKYETTLFNQTIMYPPHITPRQDLPV
jgi:hypothetical protein